MPCKHEGGTDLCVRNSQRQCIQSRPSVNRRYYEHNLTPSSLHKGHHRGKSTAACELFVRADLSQRGYEVTVPVSPTAVHDLHVELPSAGWRGVQVKAGVLNNNNGKLWLKAKRTNIKSPILAVVHMPTLRIDYRAGTEPLPPELQP